MNEASPNIGFKIKMTMFASILIVWQTNVITISPAAKGGNLAKIPPNQVIADFGRGSSVESESE